MCVIRNFYFGPQSTYLKHPVPFFICLLSCISSVSQTSIQQNDSAYYPVGYQNIVTMDSTRRYKPGVKLSDRFYYRPLEIDIWYPARDPQSISPVRYGEFLNLLEQRSNRFQNDTVYKSLSTDLLQYISVNLNIADSSAVKNLKTKSLPDAVPIMQKFPLIMYMSSYNGMSYENISLFEKLAAHGYVVACITSVGRYPGNMSTKKEDLMEQVSDGAFALNFLKSRGNIDPYRTGAIGYSWGGLAALILAMNQDNIKAVLSLDGSEMHYYGESRMEDNDFDSLRSSPAFQVNRLHIPYAYLESGFKQDDQQADSVFNIIPSLKEPKFYAHFPKARHEDFSSLSLLAANISPTYYSGSGLDSLFIHITLNYFNQFLKNQGQPFTRQLAGIYAQHLGDSLYAEMHPVQKKEYLLTGKLEDLNSHEVLAYANMGIPDKNLGTVSQRDGNFELRVSAGLLNDSLKISTIGYQSQTLSISDLINAPKPLVIPLKQQVTALQEVYVSRKKPVVKTLGNTTTSTFVSVGLPLKFLGSEIGVKINLGKKPVLLKSFTFNISSSRLDTAVFRLNIYNFKNGNPVENALQKNILVTVGQRTGKYTIPLSEYKLMMRDDILISLEWIEGSGSGPDKGAIFLSAAFLNSPTWHRLTSQAKWKKASGLGVGFHIEVQK